MGLASTLLRAASKPPATTAIKEKTSKKVA
jgi:hypothetical protein